VRKDGGVFGYAGGSAIVAHSVSYGCVERGMEFKNICDAAEHSDHSKHHGMVNLLTRQFKLNSEAEDIS